MSSWRLRRNEIGDVSCPPTLQAAVTLERIQGSCLRSGGSDQTPARVCLIWCMSPQFVPVCDMRGCPLHVGYRGAKAHVRWTGTHSQEAHPFPRMCKRPPASTVAATRFERVKGRDLPAIFDGNTGDAEVALSSRVPSRASGSGARLSGPPPTLERSEMRASSSTTPSPSHSGRVFTANPPFSCR